MDKKLLKEIKDDGFYTFIRRHVDNTDVVDILLNFVDLSTANLNDIEYVELLKRVANEKEYN